MSAIFFEADISVDRFFAGDKRSPHNPLGDGGPAIHNRICRQKAFWQKMVMERREENGPDSIMIRDTFSRTGAYIRGKRMCEEGEANWPEDLFKAQVYILTHEKHQPWVLKS